MADFPGVVDRTPNLALSSLSEASPLSDVCVGTGATASAAIWPTANTAIYMPVILQVPATVFRMAFYVAVQSGNIDVGIYDELGNRLVSSGSTVVDVAGIQIVDITDTPLTPGVYYLAMCCDNITASFHRVSPGTNFLRMAGMVSQAVGAVTLPNPATFAAGVTGYAPVLTASLVATI